MHVIHSSSPDSGLYLTLKDLQKFGFQSESRNGPVLRFPTPVCIAHLDPRKLMVTWPKRKVNPFFSIFETIWMLAGREDLAPLLPYNSTFGQYSDDGRSVRGSAYGKRWRSWFGHDQLEDLIQKLRKNPEDRRIVLQMWDAFSDPVVDSRDVPCNTNVYFSLVPESGGDLRLDMTVCNRSNDIIYGMFGSNVVHFSILLLYVAERLEVKPGTYYQMSTNAHLYLENEVSKTCLENLEDLRHHIGTAPELTYRDSVVAPIEIYDKFVSNVFETDTAGWPDWIRSSIQPAMQAYRIYKLSLNGLKFDPMTRKKLALEILDAVEDPYLAFVFKNWMGEL